MSLKGGLFGNHFLVCVYKWYFFSTGIEGWTALNQEAVVQSNGTFVPI
jgi:hypothetical protein